MNIQRFLTRRGLIIIGITFAVLVIGLSLLGIALRSNDVDTKVTEMNFKQTSFKSPFGIDSLAGSKNLYFSNGQAIVRYNPDSGEISQLTNPGQLPAISKIILSADGKGAVLQSTKHLYYDQLGSILKSRSLSMTRAYWWYVDFDTKQFRLLTDSVDAPANYRAVERQTGTDNFVAMTVVGGRTILDTLNATAEVTGSLTVDQLILSYTPTRDALWYFTGGKVHKAAADGSAAQPVIEGVQNASISPDGTWALVTKRESNEDSVVNLSTKQTIFTMPSQESSKAWTRDGKTVFITGHQAQSIANQTTVTAINTETKLQTVYTNKLAAGRDYERMVFAHDESLAGFVGPNEVIYLGSLSAIKPDKFTLPTTAFKVSSGPTTIQYFPKYGYFIASVTGKDTPESRDRAYRLLRTRGYEPLLTNMKFNFIDP